MSSARPASCVRSRVRRARWTASRAIAVLRSSSVISPSATSTPATSSTVKSDARWTRGRAPGDGRGPVGGPAGPARWGMGGIVPGEHSAFQAAEGDGGTRLPEHGRPPPAGSRSARVQAMSTSPGPVLLSLPGLHAEVELSRPFCRGARARGERCPGAPARAARGVTHAVIHGDDASRKAEIERVPLDERARATYADPQEATEEGAEGIAISVARRIFGRIVFQRLPKGTGADYLMRDPLER